MTFSFWCESIKFQAKESGGGNSSMTSIEDDLHLGPWYQLQVILEPLQVGGYSQIRTTSSCVDFEFDVTMDSKWKTVRAFTIITALLGGFLTIPLWFIPFFGLGRIAKSTWNSAALVFGVVLTFCQGLTFLIFQSNACNASAVMFPTNFVSYWEEECSWDSGSTANVIAVVGWLLTGMVMLISGPPRQHSPETTTHTVTYQRTVAPDGTTVVTEATVVVKGTSRPLSSPQQEEQPELA